MNPRSAPPGRAAADLIETFRRENPMYDLITVGDATLDVFLNLHEANVFCNLRADTCELCLNYAEKIPVESVTQVAGAGNASNAAVGASRLGLSAAIISVLGDDLVARQVVKKWEDEGVSLEYVTFDPKHATNYSTVLNFRAERTELVFAEPRVYAWPAKLPKAAWIYYTSLGRGGEIMHKPMVRYIKKTGAKLAFQPDAYQLRLGLKELKPLCAIAEVLIMNREEARLLVGTKAAKSMKAELRDLRATGCRLAVITDGENGSYVYDGKTFYHMGIIDMPVVEKTGAGDAFAVAFVAALQHGNDIPDAMRWGTANSASVIGAIGPQAGLLTRSALHKLIDRFPDLGYDKL